MCVSFNCLQIEMKTLVGDKSSTIIDCGFNFYFFVKTQLNKLVLLF